MSDFLTMLARHEVPIKVRSPLYGNYLFISTDWKKGDRVVEAHMRNDVRNDFLLKPGTDGRYRLLGRAHRLWVFVSSDKDGADHVVEAHADAGDVRNEFDLRAVGENRFRAYSPHYGQYLFVSRRKSGYDYVVEAHGSPDEERNVFTLELPDPVSYTLKDVQYTIPPLPLDEPAGEIHQIELTNPLDREQVMSTNITLSYTTEESWSSDVGVKAGVSTTVQAGIPHVAEGKVEVSVESSFSHSWGEKRSETRTIVRTVQTPVPPHSRIVGTYRLWVKRLNVPYTGTLVVHYKGTFGEGDYEQPIKGAYHGVAASILRVDFGEAAMQNGVTLRL